MASTQALEELPKESNNENDSQQKQKNRRQKLLCEILLDFAKNTTLHGLRYIAERGLSVTEKMFWIVTTITSLCLCALLIGKVWVKWQTSPIIVTLSEQLVSATEIPFPAVTICPQTKIRQELYNFTENKIKLSIFRNDNDNLSDTSFEEAYNNFMEMNPSMNELHGISLVCSIYGDFDDLPVKYVNFTAVQSIQKISPQLNDILHHGIWRNRVFLPERRIFNPVLTEQGVCFTFNNLHTEEIFHMDRIQSKYKYMEARFRQNGWSLQDGYSNISKETYPFPGRIYGREPDMQLYMKEVMDRDILCDGVNRGYKVYLHHPADFPQSWLHYYGVLPDQVTSFAIKATVMETSDALADYPPHVRQCYFPSERDLQYFKVYTPSNCLLECLTNYTLEYCGCVSFHMPHKDDVKICSIYMVTCVFNALESFSTKLGTKNTNASSCDCMPLCNSVQYEAEVLKTNYNANAYKNKINHVKEIIKNQSQHIGEKHGELSKYDYTDSNIKIEMYFKEPSFVSMRRSELFGLTDFLANCGGLLGLFLGFSFLSLVEIFYFFTLRLSCRLRRNNKAEEK